MNKPFRTNKADLAILKDTNNYRVLDLESRQPTKSAYYHNSINGYHAAKLRRFDEVFDFYLSKNNQNVLSLFNVKYIIAPDEETGVYPFPNPEANGNAWFVSEIKKLNSANEEILALDKLKHKTVAVTTETLLKNSVFKVDSLASIQVKTYQPNKIEYISSNINKGFAVFSEMYYGNGWKATIDGKEQAINRVDYTLRGLEIPAGKHTIIFSFEPQVVKTGSTITLVTSIIVILLLFGGLFISFKQKNA